MIHIGSYIYWQQRRILSVIVNFDLTGHDIETFRLSCCDYSTVYNTTECSVGNLGVQTSCQESRQTVGRQNPLPAADNCPRTFVKTASFGFNPFNQRTYLVSHRRPVPYWNGYMTVVLLVPGDLWLITVKQYQWSSSGSVIWNHFHVSN